MDRQPRHFKASPYTVSTSLDEEVVLLNTHTGRYYLLDVVGQRMWSLLLEQGQIPPVVQILAEEYDVPREQLEQDLLDLVQQLEQNGLLCRTAQESEAPV